METDKEHDLKELLVNEKTKLMTGKVRDTGTNWAGLAERWLAFSDIASILCCLTHLPE